MSPPANTTLVYIGKKKPSVFDHCQSLIWSQHFSRTCYWVWCTGSRWWCFPTSFPKSPSNKKKNKKLLCFQFWITWSWFMNQFHFTFLEDVVTVLWVIKEKALSECSLSTKCYNCAFMRGAENILPVFMNSTHFTWSSLNSALTGLLDLSSWKCLCQQCLFLLFFFMALVLVKGVIRVWVHQNDSEFPNLMSHTQPQYYHTDNYTVRKPHLEACTVR